MNVLYITWDGPDTTYLEGLFVPIFAGLAAHGITVHVVQLAWGPAERLAECRAACGRAGIPYVLVPVERRGGPLGQFYSVLRGARAVRTYLTEHAIDLLMPRSVLAGAVGLLAQSRGKPAIAYEADGLQIDERVEFGGFRRGSRVHRALTAVEARLLRTCLGALCRTDFGREVVIDRSGGHLSTANVEVVRNGRDERVFHPHTEHDRAKVRARLGIARDGPVVVYAGSLGPQYCAADMAAFFRAVRAQRADARFLILSRSELEAERLRVACGEGVVTIGVPPAQVPGLLAAGDVGLSFRAPSFSTRAVSPIKVGEYLLSGVPTLTNEDRGADRALRSFALSPQGHADAAGWLTQDVLPHREAMRIRARDLGVAKYGLRATIDRYAEFLEMTGRRQPAASG